MMRTCFMTSVDLHAEGARAVRAARGRRRAVADGQAAALAPEDPDNLAAAVDDRHVVEAPAHHHGGDRLHLSLIHI